MLISSSSPAAARRAMAHASATSSAQVAMMVPEETRPILWPARPTRCSRRDTRRCRDGGTAACVVCADNIVFAHDSVREKPLFENLTINIRSSEKIGLVGHSGSGKTTLTKLLLRFNDVQKGKITIDGQNIKSLKFVVNLLFFYDVCLKGLKRLIQTLC